MQPGYWIRSKPVYSGLQWQLKAQAHVLIASGEGGRALLRLLQQRLPQQPVQVLYLAAAHDQNKDQDKHQDKHQLKAALGHVLAAGLEPSLSTYEQAAEFWPALQQVLAASRMGTRIYAAGDEAFLWQVSAHAALHGVLNADIMREQLATLARSVYCVHCKTITQHITTNIATCSACQRQLLVRDHFSRRLGAYMGLMIDAEEPGNVPEILEIYP